MTARNIASVVREIELRVRTVLEGSGPAHDWWHTHRVRSLALRIAREEGANLEIVELAALLHDVVDWKLRGRPCAARWETVASWLAEGGLPADMVTTVRAIIEGVSFRGAGVPDAALSLEGQIVQDADRLDAIGAIGIARAFSFGGARGEQIHEPDTDPRYHRSFEEYQRKQSTTVNHFFEKLLLLRDRMHTSAAKGMANQRHEFMNNVVSRFLSEWEGDK